MGSTAFVVILGMSTVFVGLIVIILLCKLMSFFVKVTEGAPQVAPQAVTTAPAPVSPAAPIQDKGAVIAAVSAVVAEELGTSVSNIRIHSIKRV